MLSIHTSLKAYQHGCPRVIYSQYMKRRCFTQQRVQTGHFLIKIRLAEESDALRRLHGPDLINDLGW